MLGSACLGTLLAVLAGVGRASPAAAAGLAVCLLCLWRAHAAWLMGLRAEARAARGVAAVATVMAVYHPFCASGGGGERVLWKMLHTLGELHAEGKVNLHVVIIAASQGKTPEAILRGARERFGINVGAAAVPAGKDNDTGTGKGKGGAAADEAGAPRMPIDFAFVPPATVGLLAAERWPRFTMVGQSLGSLAVCWAGLAACGADAYLDTTGAAFTLPLARLFFGCGGRVGAYVHYPTISTDMLRVVVERRPAFNNAIAEPAAAGSATAGSGAVSTAAAGAGGLEGRGAGGAGDRGLSLLALVRSRLGSAAKAVYYCLFAAAYALAGAAADTVRTNHTHACIDPAAPHAPVTHPHHSYDNWIARPPPAFLTASCGYFTHYSCCYHVFLYATHENGTTSAD